jgi:CheY-like chemotaxis protein
MSIIVIVDDRSINRTIYAKLAQSMGPEVEVRDFGDPAEALVWLAHNRADLIITDHDMPRIDGGEFITRFRALPDAQRVPVMMITVNDKRVARLRALESGANDFLHSPIDHCEFVMRARNLLQLARAVEARPEVAAESNRNAASQAQKPGKPEDWRFALRLDLNSGRVTGAQALRDGRPAALADPDDLRVVLASAGQLRASYREPVRFTLTAGLDRESSAPAALALAGQLAQTGVAPCWLDLLFDAAGIVAAPDRAEAEAAAFDALGTPLTVELGALTREAGKDGRFAEPLERFIARWRPSLAFDCPQAPDDALRLARRLTGARRERKAPFIAKGVGGAALLTPLRRAGVHEAQGACFGAPFAARDLPGLFAPARDAALKRPA